MLPILSLEGLKAEIMADIQSRLQPGALVPAKKRDILGALYVLSLLQIAPLTVKLKHMSVVFNSLWVILKRFQPVAAVSPEDVIGLLEEIKLGLPGDK